VKYLYIVLIAAVIIPLRLWMSRKRRSRRAEKYPTDNLTKSADPIESTEPSPTPSRPSRLLSLEGAFGDVGIVAMREIKERVRGRILRIGTLIILIVVAAAIIIPTLHSGSGPTIQTVGVVGDLSPEARLAVDTAGTQNQDSVKYVTEPSLASAKANLRSGKVDVVIVDSDRVVLNKPASSSSSPADPGLVQAVADYLGVLKTYQAAGLTPTQATEVSQAKPVPVQTLEPSSKGTTQTTSIIGLVILFTMLTQYNTWILIGVMQEKSSRVVEVLLATVRPIQLLGGKVLGIGLVALAQATLIVGFALIVGAAVGSDLLHGSAPLVLVSQLLWLVLGYAFYCWVYAAGGSTAERQDQVQTLALPLSIPILLGYVFSITVVSSGHADLFYKVLAYLPPTAPFCMPVLVGLNQVTWWQFLASVLITIAGTFGMAIFAARIYRRAVLRTGGRVRMRELIARRAH
jgi:ABC-2 type transport system permease protein